MTWMNDNLHVHRHTNDYAFKQKKRLKVPKTQNKEWKSSKICSVIPSLLFL